MAQLLIWAACLPGCSAQAAPPDTGQVVATSSDDEAESEVVLAAVRQAIAAADFTKLNAMERDFQTSRARTPSGLWKLAVFHAGLQAYLADGLKQADGCEYRKAAYVRRWVMFTPTAPGPVITDAALRLAQAWCIRGSGYASTVPAQAWPEFRKGVAFASELLERHKAAASVDPEFYTVTLDALRAEGAGRVKFSDVLEEATDREPYYHRTYFKAAWYYLPQWGGSFAEVERFARYAADRTRTSEHDGFYARVFWALDECGCDTTAKAADWPTLKKAMRDVFDRYPVRWNGQYFADVACRMGDREESRRYESEMPAESPNEGALVTPTEGCGPIQPRN